MTWRETRAAGRAVVHDTFKVAALFLASFPFDSNSGEHPPTIKVRVHNTEKALGINPQQADDIEPQPKLVFWVDDLVTAGVTLANKAVISVETGEAYRIGVIHPQDRETITCDVVKLTAAQASGLPVPE